jgi:hypothetical protein
MIFSIEPKLPELPSGKWIAVILVLIVSVIVLSLSKCGSPDPVNFNTIEKKEVIVKQKRIADSLDRRSDISDSIRIVYVTRWRKTKVRIDTIPCPEALADVLILTDSIIQIDSTQISQLNAEIFLKDLVIANQDTLLKIDSVTIRQKDKKIKRLKRQRNLAVGVGVAGWILAAFK